MIYHINQRFYVTVALGESVALLVARRTNNQPTIGRLQVRLCITVLTGSRMRWTARCGRSPLLLPSCRKLEFGLSALIDSDLAWVNGKSGRQSWRNADAFQRSIISEAIYHLTEHHEKYKKAMLSQGNRAMPRVISLIPIPPRISGWSLWWSLGAGRCFFANR